jgi:flagellin-specific chaperone FliS
MIEGIVKALGITLTGSRSTLIDHKNLDKRSRYLGVALDLIRSANRWLAENRPNIKADIDPYWESIYQEFVKYAASKGVLELDRMREIKTVKQLESAWNELKEEILDRPLFLNNGNEAKAERKARCEYGVWEFARTYFPDYVPAEGAVFHEEWERIQRIENKPVLLMAFRGSGKSTFFSLLDPIHAVAYGRWNSMIFSSYNEEQSAVFSGRILLELLHNQRLINDFGGFIPNGRQVGVKNFTAKAEAEEIKNLTGNSGREETSMDELEEIKARSESLHAELAPAYAADLGATLRRNAGSYFLSRV